MTAHPKTDPVTGELVFLRLPRRSPRTCGSTPLAPTARCTWSTEGGAARAGDDARLRDHRHQGRHLRPAGRVRRRTPLIAGEPGIYWDADRGARIGLLDRGADEDATQWIEVDPFWVFHFLNAHEDGDRIVIDACRLPRMDIGLDPAAPAMPAGEDPAGYLTRFTVDRAAGRVTHERIAELSGDFPRIDDRLAGRRHRMGYVRDLRDRPGPIDPGGRRPVRLDHRLRPRPRDRVQLHRRSGRVIGEPVVAADPTRADGEGWVMSYVYDRATDRSAVHVLDASDIAAGPVATVQLPRRVPFGFHGRLPAASSGGDQVPSPPLPGAIGDDAAARPRSCPAARPRRASRR